MVETVWGIDDTPEFTCVPFTVPEKRLAAMDVALGPCVPLPGRKHALRSVHSQHGPERVEQMTWLYVALGGAERDRHSSMHLIEQNGPGALYRCSDEFVRMMARANEEHIRLGAADKADGDKQLTRFVAANDALDAEWLRIGRWHRAQVSTSYRLIRIAWARIALEKAQPLYCWYGPSVPEYEILVGTFGGDDGNRTRTISLED